MTMNTLFPAAKPREASTLLRWRLLTEVAFHLYDLGAIYSSLLGRRADLRPHDIIPARIIKRRYVRCCPQGISKALNLQVLRRLSGRTQQHILGRETSGRT